VTTSVKKQDGERAFKTLLDRNHPAYALMNEGKTYVGRASLFGREYMSVYEPIREGNRTIGILYIGSDIGAILGKLETVMAAQKLFTSGAVYAVNLSSGPARGSVFGLPGAGKLLKVDEKDDDAKTWLASLAAIEQAGNLESKWSPRRSAEGDRATRFVAIERYKPWSWAIVAEAPLTEMMGEARYVLTWLWLGLAVALALLAVVLVAATRRLVGLPVQQLSTALGYLAQGDLTHEVSIRSREESALWPRPWKGFACAWWKAWARCAPVPTACRPPAPKSHKATRTFLVAPKARPARWRKQPPAWSNWGPPFATTPTAPARPTSWPWAPAAWQRRAVKWCRRWCAPCTTSTPVARKSPTSLA
jgi:methyl-accepting chemotaxis protein-2 (aspartate sensor receptor)